MAPVLEAALRKGPEFFVSDPPSPVITEQDINDTYEKCLNQLSRLTQ